MLCRADLDRQLTDGERVWFDSAPTLLEPSPRRFVFTLASAHFLCPPGEQGAWLAALQRYLEQAWEAGD